MSKIKLTLLSTLCFFIAITLSGCSLLNNSTEDNVITEEIVTCQTNSECADDEICSDNTCQPLLCDECQYASANECVDYECCINQDCGDQDRSTRDICKGEPRTCTHELITECIPNDFYCPSGCEYDPDTDCEEPEPDPEAITTTDCGTDLTCFQESLSSCSPATYQYNLLGFSYDITVSEIGNACVINHLCTSTHTESTEHLIGLSYECVISKSELAVNVDVYMDVTNNITEECAGTYVDAMIELMNQEND